MSHSIRASWSDTSNGGAGLAGVDHDPWLCDEGEAVVVVVPEPCICKDGVSRRQSSGMLAGTGSLLWPPSLSKAPTRDAAANFARMACNWRFSFKHRASSAKKSSYSLAVGGPPAAPRLPLPADMAAVVVAVLRLRLSSSTECAKVQAGPKLHPPRRASMHNRGLATPVRRRPPRMCPAATGFHVVPLAAPMSQCANLQEAPKWQPAP
mmetsp:Transcript_9628/g.27604  ORF Transcript_9628/g.27604 Transcript_9628/m.27604 type:complete len:208 (-) Transcript_9628:107-730(-)